MASNSKNIAELLNSDTQIALADIADGSISDDKISDVSATKLTGTVSVNNGGTGASDAGSAINNLLGSGTSGYVLKTGGAGSYYWGSANAVSGNSVGTIINSTRLIHTATASQTVFAAPTYTTGAGQLRVYIDGVRQFPSAVTETSNTSFTLDTGVSSGTVVMAEVDAYTDYTVNASDVVFSPTSDVTSNNAQDAIAEVASDLSSLVVQTSGIADSAVTTTKIADANVTMAKLSATGSASSSTFLRGDGSWQAAGGFANMEVFSIAGPATWTNPGQVTKVKVTVVGAGGAGGGTTVSPSPTNGNAGGTSSFGTYMSATGGGGGGNTRGAAGGASGGNFVVYGKTGNREGSGPAATTTPVYGGDSLLGFGGHPSTPGSGFGSGGGVTSYGPINLYSGSAGGATVGIISIPTSPVPITVGAGGTAGPGTWPGPSGQYVPGLGADGVVIVEY